jgi:hypothetical protein
VEFRLSVLWGPAGERFRRGQRAGHRYIVENIGLPALLAYRRSG